MSEPLKTITLGPDGEDDPRWTICKGHVDAKTFSEAFEAEGWSGDEYDQEDLSHEWWKQDDNGKWWSSTKDDPKAVPVTVSEW